MSVGTDGCNPGFVIEGQIGSLAVCARLRRALLFIELQVLINSVKYILIGDGSYSSVYKVRRVEDGLIYALKKVKI